MLTIKLMFKEWHAERFIHYRYKFLAIYMISYIYDSFLDNIWCKIIYFEDSDECLTTMTAAIIEEKK